MHSTMQDVPLTVGAILRHGLALYGDSEIVTCTAEGSRRSTFDDVGMRAARLANALRGLGVGDGDRVGTFLWNDVAHQECYLAIPGMGAVLHTINIRLFPEQIAYVVNHAADSAVIVGADLIPLLQAAWPQIHGVAHVVLVGSTGPADFAGAEVHDYDALLRSAGAEFSWRTDIDERSAAAVCYTSGTTGNPKGVVYSHRSTYLHAVGVCVGNVYGMTQHDRVVPIVPMFHANAWGLPYAAWVSGADLLMPSRFLQAARLTAFMREERATVAAAVPTVWSDVLAWSLQHDVDFPSVRMLVGGGSAVAVSLMREFDERLGVPLIQGWGMTETSPVAALALPPKGTIGDEWLWRGRTGRIVAGVECRIVNDAGDELPRDGRAVGEFECRGPWVAGSYHDVADPERFDRGWLRTGDVGTLDARGYMQITDRAKDLIKSGGEWISSVVLETTLVGHPGVAEAAVIAVPDPRWQERPLALIVPAGESDVTVEQLQEYLGDHVARWQVPERWAVIDRIPRTSVGKFDKKVLRDRYAAGGIDVRYVELARR